MKLECKQIYTRYEKLAGKEITFIGRIRSNRSGKAVSFVTINDGTTINDVQVVYKEEHTAGFAEAQSARVSTIIEVTGELIVTPDKQQPFEISATKIKVLDLAIEEYPLQKKEHSPEFLREIAPLRARTKTFAAIFRIRSAAAYAIHKYFQEENYVYVNSPILTGNDAEGAGEAFAVVTEEDGKLTDNFFGKRANLTVSGQLNAEAFAQAFKKVYTFGPTFRAENSNTVKHAAEFWMVEPEIAFADINQIIKMAESMLKKVVKYVLKNNADDINFLVENQDPELLDRLTTLVESKFARIKYAEAIKLLQKAIADGHVFEENNVFFGLDLGTEHEKYISEVIFKKPTFLTDYPQEIKAFYMKLSKDKKTVAAVDLLVPGIGELIGGSQREDDYKKIMERTIGMGIKTESLEWYLDLRHYGYFKSAGFGLGFERLIMYLTGVQNIRDVIPFPRTPRNLQF